MCAFKELFLTTSMKAFLSFLMANVRLCSIEFAKLLQLFFSLGVQIFLRSCLRMTFTAMDVERQQNDTDATCWDYVEVRRRGACTAMQAGKFRSVDCSKFEQCATFVLASTSVITAQSFEYLFFGYIFSIVFYFHFSFFPPIHPSI